MRSAVHRAAQTRPNRVVRTSLNRRQQCLALFNDSRVTNMTFQVRPDITVANIIGPLVVALVFIAACSLLKEPTRRSFSAIMIAGAGAAYLNGGLLGWEFAFCSLMTWIAYKGLANYRFIALGWLLHTMWDVVHHLYGNSIVPFAPLSSFGCAICDTALAAWYFAGAPSITTWLQISKDRSSQT